jgi:hypothetical protein
LSCLGESALLCKATWPRCGTVMVESTLKAPAIASHQLS